MKLAVIDPADPLLRSIFDLPPPPNGLTQFDMVKQSPLPEIRRTYTVVSGPASVDRYSVVAGHLLAPGAAVALVADGLVRHLYMGREGSFVGFVVSMLSNDRVAVRTQGIAALSVAGASPQDQGKAVYATEPNAFNLESGILLGRVVYCAEPGKAMVIFASRGVIEPQHWRHAVSAFSR